MTTPPSDATGLSDLRRLLHNIDDHTQVLHRHFLAGGLAQPFQGTLMAHIRHEEAENRRQLELLKGNPAFPTYEIDTVIQHSELLAQLTEDSASDPALLAEILHHFMEEHEGFAETFARLAGEGTARSAGMLTVGSMIGRD